MPYFQIKQYFLTSAMQNVLNIYVWAYIFLFPNFPPIWKEDFIEPDGKRNLQNIEIGPHSTIHQNEMFLIFKIVLHSLFTLCFPIFICVVLGHYQLILL